MEGQRTTPFKVEPHPDWFNDRIIVHEAAPKKCESEYTGGSSIKDR